MKKLVTPAVLAMGLLVLSNTAAAQTEGDAQAGKAKSQTCVACHGEDGNSPAPNFPKIAGLGENYLYKQLQDIKLAKPEEGGRYVPEMTGLLDGFSDQDLRDISAYYAEQSMTLTGSKEAQVRVNSGMMLDSLALGRNLYRFGNSETKIPACTGCHSPTGQGNAPAGYPRLGGQYAEYIVKQLQAFRGGERLNDGESQVMRDIANHMSDAEIAAVANYVAGLYQAPNPETQETP